MKTCRLGILMLASLVLGSTATAAQERNLSVQQQLVAAVESPVGAQLHVTAWVDHNNNRYRLGDEINLFVKVNADAYLTIVSVGPSGDVVQLYPNELQSGGLVKSGRTVKIPGKGSARIVATAPAGNELIRVIASSEPVTVIDRSLLRGAGTFKSIEGGAGQLAKDLTVVAAKPSVAFYDKVIKTVADNGTRAMGEGTAAEEEASVEISIGDEQEAIDRKPPLIATDADEYEVGETVSLAVTALEPCNLWVVDVSSDESIHVLFPNKLMKDNALDSSQTAVISGGESEVKVLVGGEGGTKEAIYALCSEDDTPPWEAGVDFTDLFPELDGKSGLGKSLLAQAANEDDAPIPDVYSWSVANIIVAK